MGRLVFHIARRQDWEAAQIDCEYRVSTLGRSLDDVGFIHCSASRDQVLAVASAFYESVSEPLVLLTIEVDHVGSEVRDEFTGDSPEPFPHVYGPIPVSSVTVVGDLHRDADGAFSWPIAWPDSAWATRARTGSMRDMADTSDVESVERVIAAPPEAIFELLADPRRHQDIDGSGTVRDAKGEPQRLALGSEFGMSMKMGVPYAMVSTVVEFDDNRRIAWQTRGPTRLGSWAGGRIWRYEIEPVDGGSLVRESWDISQESAITKPFVRMGATKTRENMAKTLARIEEITTG